MFVEVFTAVKAVIAKISRQFHFVLSVTTITATNYLSYLFAVIFGLKIIYKIGMQFRGWKFLLRNG